MDLQVMEKPDLDSFVRNLISHYPVEGVKEKDGSFLYGTLHSSRDLRLDFDCTLFPPKKYFLPPKETLFRFALAPTPEVMPMMDEDPFVLFGVHPYDLKAIGQMDRIFARGVSDPHYLKRRAAAIIIGIDPLAVSPRSFWADMGAATVSGGFDLMLTDLGERFAVEVGSEKGGRLIADYAVVRPASREEAQRRGQIRYQISQLSMTRGLRFPKREIPKLLERSKQNLIWEEQASKCLGCGTCNLVCPTCYCFDVQDEMGLDLVGGERIRRWDGCLLHDFAKVATGENFRESRTARYRHRFFRKAVYLNGILDDMACVGCGRCSMSCLADIADPVKLFNRLKEDEIQGGL